MRKYCSQIVLENFFEPCILFLLMNKPSYGYEIQRELKTRCSCKVNIGNLYRCLFRMQKLGYIKRKNIKGDKGPTRYSYTILIKGGAYLADWIEALKKQNKIISLLIKNYQKII